MQSNFKSSPIWLETLEPGNQANIASDVYQDLDSFLSNWFKWSLMIRLLNNDINTCLSMTGITHNIIYLYLCLRNCVLYQTRISLGFYFICSVPVYNKKKLMEVKVNFGNKLD